MLAVQCVACGGRAVAGVMAVTAMVWVLGGEGGAGWIC